MRYYAKDNNGRDIFFVEVADLLNRTDNESDEDVYYIFSEDFLDVTCFIRSTLPIQIFILFDVYELVNSLFKKYLMSESIDDKDINNLISLLKSKEQFSFYYFQEIELNRHGKYDESKASVMSAILDKSGVELKVPYNIQNTPYEFRYISQKLNLVGMLDEFREISKHDFEKTIRYENRIIDCYISIMNEDNRYRKMNVEVDGVGAWLFVLLFRSYPHLLFILPGD